MARSLEAPTKRAKRLGLLTENTVPARGGRKLSDYGVRLKEKQKAKFIYGVLERQFRNYFEESKRKAISFRRAAKTAANTGELLLGLLEQRLDNVVYRLGYARTRAQARQLVAHGHVRVSGAKVKTPSYQVKPEQVISLSDTAANSLFVKEAARENPPEKLPSWLTRKGLIGRIVRSPKREEMEQSINEALIIEYYSR